MTGPGVRGPSYIEPLTPEAVERSSSASGPTALLPTVVARPRSLAVERRSAACWTGSALRLIGASAPRGRGGEDRSCSSRRWPGWGSTCEERLRHDARGSQAGAEADPAARGDPAVVHLRRHRRRIAYTVRVRGARAARHRPLARPPGPDRGVRARLEEYELEVDAGQGRQLRGDLLDRELRPDGHHTGDSVTVAPAQTLTDREYQGDAQRRARDHSRGRGRRAARTSVRGGPEERPPDRDRDEPRVSRSSALASKATGFPIARSRRFCDGDRPPPITHEIQNDITRVTPAVVSTGDRLRGGEDPALGVREVQGREPRAWDADEVRGRGDAIGRTFQEALQKGCAASRPASPASRGTDLDDSRHPREAAQPRSRPDLLVKRALDLAGPTTRSPHDRDGPLVSTQIQQSWISRRSW